MTRQERRAADRDLRRRAAAYKPTRLTTARHESGHVLAHLAYEVPFGGVSVGPQVTADGRRLHGAVRGGAMDDADPWVAAVILFAGPLAEGGYLGGLLDLEKIAELDRAWISDRSASSPWTAAHRLVTVYAGQLDQAAAMLAETGTLTPRQVLDGPLGPLLGVALPTAH